MTQHAMMPEAKNDFWSIAGDFIYRHHVAPRVKLSFPIPLKYIALPEQHTRHWMYCWKEILMIAGRLDGEKELSDGHLTDIHGSE